MAKKWGRNTPSAAEQMGQFLSVFKRQRVPFEKAWAAAGQRITFEHDTTRRLESKEVLEWARPFFEAGYTDQEVPGGRGALAMRAALDPERHVSNAVRPAPRVVGSPNPGKTHHEIDAAFGIAS